MREYNVGEYYNFWVTGLGNDKIYLKDDDGRLFFVHAYDFQTQWDWASPEVPVSALKCYVKQVYENGFLKLEQSNEVLLRVLYQEADRNESTEVEFVVYEPKILGNTLFFVLIDSYGLYHFYKPSKKYMSLQPGDSITLAVTGIMVQDNNKTRLIFEEIEEEILDEETLPENLAFNMAVPPVNITQYEDEEDETPVGEFGVETDMMEFKSTLIYPAGAVGPDIDTQIAVILRTIAGFLNAKGGTLYIGVNDNGDAVGIEDEYCLLNSSKKDRYSYKEDCDGYQNKLRNAMNWNLGPVAQDYVSIKFIKSDAHTVCKIDVDPSRTVIWYDERDAYKRMGNRTTYLRSTAIEKLVLDKNELHRPENRVIEPTVIQSEDELLPDNTVNDMDVEEKPVVVKVAPPAKIQMKGVQKVGRGSFYMNLFSNNEWSWSRDVPNDSDLEYCLPINNPASSHDLIMVYDDGCVNRIDAYHLHLEKRENRRYANGRRSDGAKLIKAFAATRNDMLACYCTWNGHPYVKVHPVSHVSQHSQLNLMGNRLINTRGNISATMEKICFVASEHTQRVSALFKTENQTSSSLGYQMDLQKNIQKYSQVKITLDSLCDIPSKV